MFNIGGNNNGLGCTCETALVELVQLTNMLHILIST